MIRPAFSMILSLAIGVSIFGFVAMGLLQLGLGKEAVAHRYSFAPWLQLTLLALGVLAVVGGVTGQLFANRNSKIAKWFETSGLVVFATCFIAVIFVVTLSFFTGLGRAI